MRLHRPAARQRAQQRPRGQLLGPVRRARRAPSARPTTRRRSSSRRRPGRSPGRCRRPRAGRRSRRRRPRAGSPRGWRCGSTSRSRWRTRSAARGRSARWGCRASRRPPGNRSRHLERRVAPRRPPRAGTTAPAASRASACVEVVGAVAPAARRGWPPPSRPARRRWRRCSRPPSAGPSRAASAYAGSPRSSRVPAHHADQARGRRPSRSSAWSIGVVVQGPGRAPRSGSPCSLRPGVGAGVERVGVPRRVVQLLGGVERGAVGVDRHAGTAGSTSAPGASTARRRPRRSVQPRNVAPATVQRRGPALPSVRSRPRTRQPAAWWPRRPAAGRTPRGTRPRRRGRGCVSRRRT